MRKVFKLSDGVRNNPKAIVEHVEAVVSLNKAMGFQVFSYCLYCPVSTAARMHSSPRP